MQCDIPGCGYTAICVKMLDTPDDVIGVYQEGFKMCEVHYKEYLACSEAVPEMCVSLSMVYVEKEWNT